MAARASGRAGKAAGTEAIEVKVTLAERAEDALRRFRLARADAERRRIFFYDTRELGLFENGIALRAREMEGDVCDSTVKIRPVEPKRVGERWRRMEGFELEADAVGPKVIRSASLTCPRQPKEIEEVATGSRSIETLFTGDQEEFLKEMSPVVVDWSELVALGPVAALRWKFEHTGLPYALWAEEWRLPDGRDVIEISIQAKREEAAAAQAALLGFLDELGIGHQSSQQPKTRIALEYFAKGGVSPAIPPVFQDSALLVRSTEMDPTAERVIVSSDRALAVDTPVVQRAKGERRTRGGARRASRERDKQQQQMQQQGAALDSEREHTITRYPTIDLAGEVKPRTQVEIVVDLALERDESTETAGLTVTFPARVEEVPISVRLSCPELEFEEGADRGTITLRKAGPSRPWRTTATVSAELGDSIVVRALFSYDGRHCGSAKRAFAAAGQAEDASARAEARTKNVVSKEIPPAVPVRKTSPVPELPRVEASRGRTTGVVETDLEAPSPTLTIEMTKEQGTPGIYQWDLDMPRHVRRRCSLPRRLNCKVDLGTEAAQFVTDLFPQIEELLEPDHLAFFQGLGDDLYARTPQCFKDTYWALVDSEGPAFPIQILSDEPFIPWELMRPSRGTPGEAVDFLGSNHPVGRWFLDHEGVLRPSLQKGNVATIAPDYSGRPELGKLPDARSESKAICSRLKSRARSLAGRKRAMLDLLEDGGKSDLALIHFAGHGSSVSTQTKFALLYLEDDELRVYEVRRNETMLGQNRHPLVLLNACQVAQSGLNLGVIGGFAEALMHRDFGGLVAPLWAVYDDHAKDVSAEFVHEVIEEGRPFADVVRDIRKQYADRSPTFLSYLYYGDVMARFA